MPAKKTKAKRGRKKGSLSARLDVVIRLLEDLSILQAADSRVGTSKIQGILGIRKARVSKIAKSVKQARKHGEEA
jgi:hypothetical protein